LRMDPLLHQKTWFSGTLARYFSAWLLAISDSGFADLVVDLTLFGIYSPPDYILL
jgi:hypothetical protein